MKKNPFFLIFVLWLLLSACASSAAEAPAIQSPKTPPALQPTSVAGMLFQVIKLDGTRFDVTLDALKALPLAQVQGDDGKMEEGPYLSDVLALAGITQFKEVTLTGSSNPVTLTFEQVDQNTILDFNNHGTLKLSSTYVPKAKWTKDVVEITVK